MMVLVRVARCLGVGLLLVAAGAYGQGAGGETSREADTVTNKIVTDEVNSDARGQAGGESQQSVGTDAGEKLLSDAEAFMKEGKPAEAYALLEPMEFERSGEVRFDYLLGISALDSGRADKATLAFERVLAVDPNFAGARLDMARAYFQLGDMPRAKTEFEMVMEQNPPEAAKITIQKYLDVIQAQEDAKKLQITGYVEMTGGNDSNVNNSGSQSQIAVPAFGNLVFTLDPTNLKMSDNYVGLTGGMEINQAFDSGFAMYAGLDARQRNNLQQTAFDSLNVDGRAGVSYSTDSELFRLGVSAGQYTQSNDRNRDSAGIMGEWRHTFSPANQLNLFGQYGTNRFVDAALQVNDFDQSVLGLGWLHVMNDGNAVVFASYFMGNENDVAPVTVANPTGGRADGNKRFDGLRIGGQAMLSETLDIFAGLGLQQGRYDKTNAAFLTMRNDRLEDLSMGLNWRPEKLWTIRPQLTMSRNASNIVIYSYDRMDISLTIRRDFK